MPAVCRWTLLILLIAPGLGRAQQPTIADDRLVLEVVAEAPDIVTPTGLAVDEQGRIWVIENHTHQRPPQYKGPASDRIRIFSDFDDKGRARKIATFADGFKDAMSLALGKNGIVFLATRSAIHQMRDKDGAAADARVIVKLETKGNYPHNGLAGFAFDGLGDMYFGLGENLGEAYKLIGSDGTALSGGGEGGSIYRCRPDGSKLTRVATGFWNPFHLAFDAFGRLFAVDNDPDSRGPCRLLHIVNGGDYGYRFRYGRKGLHPFVAWNGELPGTLPMLAGTAEAPSGVIAYESTGLPEEYRGNLLATSWGDHVIERFRLSPQGASFVSRTQTLVRGGENFRPVGIATAPDGSVVVSDWVDKSYPVHGKGRIWRIRMKQPPADDGLRPSKLTDLEPVKLKDLLGHPKQEIRNAAAEALAAKGIRGRDEIPGVLSGKNDPRARVAALWTAARLEPDTARKLLESALTNADPAVRGEAARLFGESLPIEADKRDESALANMVAKDPSAFARMQATLQLRDRKSLAAVVPLLADSDPFLMAAALEALGRPGNLRLILPHVEAVDARLRLGALLALRRTGEKETRETLPKFLEDADPDVRRAAIQWVGEEKLTEYAPRLAASAGKAPVTRDLFLALLAANNLLEGTKPNEEPADEKFLLKTLEGADQPAAFRVLSLQMLRPDNKGIKPAVLRDLLESKDSALRLQAARTLAMRIDGESQEALLRLAASDKTEPGLKGEAVLGLAHSAATAAETRGALLGLLSQPAWRRDALRSLRDAASKPAVEKELIAWWEKSSATLPMEEQSELAAQVAQALRASKSERAQQWLPKLLELAGPRPTLGSEWQKALAKGGDAVAGERVFFHAQGPRCYTCHQVDGRGGKLGPNLSKIGWALSREKLIESILEPSKEIAPQFVSWSIVTRDGKVRIGLIIDEGPHSTITLAESPDKLEVIKRQDIEERHALSTSFMPNDLHQLMTRQEFLDLVAFLSERK
ncbi:MAG: c-type cytochrome [Gemmataceae bacterium]|nr:c-type cytochrome [Gemmataceae bacterium]